MAYQVTPGRLYSKGMCDRCAYLDGWEGGKGGKVHEVRIISYLRDSYPFGLTIQQLQRELDIDFRYLHRLIRNFLNSGRITKRWRRSEAYHDNKKGNWGRKVEQTGCFVYHLSG